nr:putative disease resistance protein At4g11170 [Ziziphus jujuba var. spinosa]
MELLKDETILSLDTPFVLSTFIQNKLHRKKVLIVLDDLDSPVDLEALVEGYYHLAPGSRIIVTTRNLQVLRKGANRIYKVEGLNHLESLELFHLHAFRKISLAPDYRVLSEKFSLYANGNPLALKVLGSFLCSRSKEEWQSALNKLKIVPNQDIHNMLRISYEGLDDTEKDIFLDIACFFNGYDRDYVESILDNGDSISKIGISVLIDKSLITENWNSWKDETELWMHDLLQQMGHAIVRGENKEPGKRSRLWIAKVVCQTFERNTGTGTIEGILFNTSEIKRDVKLNCAAFSKMYNLRFLKIYYGNLNKKFKLHPPTQGLKSYPSDKLDISSGIHILRDLCLQILFLRILLNLFYLKVSLRNFGMEPRYAYLNSVVLDKYSV